MFALRPIMLAVFSVLFLYFIYRLMRSRNHDSAWVAGLIITISLGAILGWQGYKEWQWQKYETIYSQAVAQVFNLDGLGVHCQRFSEDFFYARGAIGYVEQGGDGRPQGTALITRQRCNDLREWIESNKNNPTENQIIALHVLTHEAEHLAGVWNEKEAECKAMNMDHKMAMALGATEEQGRTLAQTYYDTVFPRMPMDYRDTGCIFTGGTTPTEETADN